MKKVTIYSDGSALGNPGPGGYGVILRHGDNEKELSGGEAHTTNNRMELLGVIEGLRCLKEPCSVTVISDSSYVIRGINEWISGWQKRNFVKVKNPEMWKDYLVVSSMHKIVGVWVRGHNGHPENERCDVLAKNAAEKFKAKR